MEFPIKSVADLERISSAAKWQYFEKLVGYIFEQNGFDVRLGVIIKDGYGIKRQFDAIASKYDKTFLVECKKWKSMKQRTGALKTAVKKHLERCELYGELNGPGTPLIVTLLEEEITSHESVHIVPIMKLNWFLNNL